MSPARRFEAKEPTIVRDLQNTMKALGATSLKIPHDLMDDTNTVAEIVFDRAGIRYVMRCSKWSHYLDNLRACERTIFYLFKALKEYGAESGKSTPTWQRAQTEAAFDRAFAEIFGGMAATPDDAVLKLGSGQRTWWDVLGIQKGATKTEIDSAYRALSKVHHPDAGGDPDMFKRLRKAYEDGLTAAGGAK
jgi:hypothetical protein